MTVENKQVKASPTGLRCGAHAQIAFTNFRGQKASSAPTLRNLSYSPQAPQDRRIAEPFNLNCSTMIYQMSGNLHPEKP
ncbi:MAG: hypothetical protein KBH33_11460 [Alicycliphilus sp.]|nr:hypothetical protein [Alicycliphilus sp.]MBP8780320.1 hypothetical protein [Alicycliphilus sp.]HRN66237.1 hypothetical protein [Alicycliphilus sp.]HRO53136.1 hypothetical protein [Alicycliphilus sp.]HRP20251.1 hypothetical protein [Alicycliphilus sp.]